MFQQQITIHFHLHGSDDVCHENYGKISRSLIFQLNFDPFIIIQLVILFIIIFKDIPALSKFVFCAILVIMQHQFVNGQNWNDGARDVKWRMHCNFPGQEIERIEATGDRCGSLCIASRECTHFHHANDGYCHLKKAPLSTSPTLITEGMCGFVPWKFEPGIK
jgi:hypothetical protein